ncbi:MAG: iron ABC transporter substrate-binding protein [Acidimicrobiia bacterium]|nr:iron ABC transporter substrate-binding protein [Acidimicrobiia bacterium]
MSRRRSLTVALAVPVALAAAASLAACSGGGDSDRLTVYSGRTKNLVGPLLEQFSEETGIGIDVRYGDSADLALLVDTEGDRSPADVFLSQSPGATGYLDGEGRLLPLTDEVLDLVDPAFRAADGEWVGISGRARTLVYNTEMVEEGELPDSVLDLVDPRYEGLVALAPTNGSFQDFVTGMRDVLGDDETLAWLEGMRDNGARTYANNTAIVEAVGRGEVAMGLVNHYYNERAKAEDPDVASENHFFEGDDIGNLVLVTAVAVLDTADDRDAAERLVEFLLSEQAQEFFAGETFEYPLAAGVEPAVDLPPLEQIGSPALDLSDLGGGLLRTKELIEQSGLERA